MKRFALPLLFALLALGSKAQSSPLPLAGSHASELACAECHVNGSETDPGQIKDCSACHDPSRNIHPIGSKPTVEIPKGFALDAEGKLLCRSCHKVHGGDPKVGFLNDAGNGYKNGRAAYCANCHGSQNARTNPHSAKRGDSRCTFCHKEDPKNPEYAEATIRTKIVKLCDFCHGAVEKNHPRNIDQSLEIPKELPRDKIGRWTCVTCHDPHGTVDTTHYVRAPFAKFMERGKDEKPHKPDYKACGSCHLESNTSGLADIGATSLRFKGDVNILCISCHTTDRSHHPTGLTIPDSMMKRLETSSSVLPLDADGRIDCYTCHDNQCSSETYEMVERNYDSKTYTTDLCWNCHDRESYAKVSPHTNNIETCTLCHDTRPAKGLPASLMAVPLMVCLHCHEVKPHPVGKSHLKMPTDIINVDPSLPLSKTGEVTCVTCHNPHYDPEDRPKRLRVNDAMSMCNMCHWKKVE